MYYIYTNAIHTSLKVLISQRGEMKYINQQIYLFNINVGHLKINSSFSDLTHNLSYRLDCLFMTMFVSLTVKFPVILIL